MNVKRNTKMFVKIGKYRFMSNVNRSQYANTIHLPKTNFPTRIPIKERSENVKFIQMHSSFDKLYSWQRENVRGNEFVLHDGPPYANGSPHIGHAINKILKDIINRYNLLKGYKVNYIPGWDCHGLPIELRALSNKKSNVQTEIEVRQSARKFATDTIDDQRECFKSWGIMADWDKNIYRTFDKSYVINQLQQFMKLYELNLVYRAVKPVFWSPSSKTALAEAELEYNPEHKSDSLIVKFKLVNVPNIITSKLPSQSLNVYALIWTTTPWSIPANQAICYSPSLTYSIIEFNKDSCFIVASDLAEEVCKNIGCSLNIVSVINGSDLKEATYQHPVYSDEVCSFLSANHVSSSKGTGLVHTAPAHGPDDFLIALENNMPIKCLIDSNGCYDQKAGSQLSGQSVLTDGSASVIKLLSDNVLFQTEYIHSYPYDWRTKQPVIINASEQWFIDTNKIKDEALKKLRHVSVIPSGGMGLQGLEKMVQSRPYWCISRQRAWGVPIPALYDKQSGKSIIDRNITDQLCQMIEIHGTDCWWSINKEELFPKELCDKLNLNIDSLEKGNDILDIWFDSGISWSSVLPENVIADICVEGADQLTGWFQSSLLTSIALRGQVPYRRLLVHGFAVDFLGRKMSKSLGNVMDPQKIIKDYGIDAMRWWIASHNMLESKITVTDNIVKLCAEELQKIRSLLKYLLGTLNGFSPEQHKLEQMNFHILDGFILHLLWNFNRQINECYENLHFNKLCKEIVNFTTNEVSGFYCHLIKHRLYCYPVHSPERRAAQYVLYNILQVLKLSLAPITPHLIEELQLHDPLSTRPFFYTSENAFVAEDEWNQPDVEPLMEKIIEIKHNLNKLSAESNTQKLNVTIKAESECYKQLKFFQSQVQSSESQLVELLQVASVTLEEAVLENNLDGFIIKIDETSLHSCERCRRYTALEVSRLCDACVFQIEANATGNWQVQ